MKNSKILTQLQQQTQRRKSSNNSNVNVSDDLQLAISKMLPNVVDLKPQVRLIIILDGFEMSKYMHLYTNTQ